MTTATDQLIDEYLQRLEGAARTLPPARRAELLAEIKEHISITRSESQDPGEATVRTILERLGDPEDIAREAGADVAAVPSADGEIAGRRRVGAFELVTVILLLVGGVVLPVLGWVVGVVLLWASARWTTRDKLIGTLLFPGGLAVLAWCLFFSSSTTACSSAGVCETSGMPAGLAVTLALVGAIASLGSAVHLLRQAGRAKS